VTEQTAQTARIWNYLLGGTDNFDVDRAAGEAVAKVNPAIRDNARAGRRLLQRAVTFLAAEAGVRQFLDVGTGLPTADNTHEVAQRAAPESRIVYVDNDPLVLALARSLLTSTPQGATAYLDADARDPGDILARAQRTLDFAQPVALIMCGVLGHLEYDEARSVVARLTAPLVPGSYLLVLDGTWSQANREAQEVWNRSANPPYHVREPEEIAAFLSGFEVIEPGVVSAPLWRPEPGEVPEHLDIYAGLGRKL
jgi:O-methyltransferase involved in polyketide biosynthesis